VYEQRRGDTPAHTIGASLFAGKGGVHSFREIGYEQYPFTHCPQGDMWERGRCSCDQERIFGMWKNRRRSLTWVGSLTFLCLDYHGGWSCLAKWEQAINERQEQRASDEYRRGERPLCVGSDTFLRKNIAQFWVFFSLHRSRPQNILFGQPRSGPSLLISCVNFYFFGGPIDYITWTFIATTRK